LFTFFVLVCGVGIVAVPSGLVASALSKAREQEREEQENLYWFSVNVTNGVES